MNTKSFDNTADFNQIDNGFIGIGDKVIIGKIEYKRFVLKEDSKVIIDGYWSIKTLDSIFFINYDSYKKKCSEDKLIFYVEDSENSHYLGRSCEDEFQYPTDVLVQYEKDTILKDVKYKRFTHSIISEDDFTDQSDAIISTRFYLLNNEYGLILEKEEGNNFRPYWYNY